MTQMMLERKLIEKFEIHKDFTKIFLDAFVLITKERKILRFNAAFCRLTGLRATDIKEIDEFEQILDLHASHDKRDILDQIFLEKKPTRIDDVLAKNLTNGRSLNLIISSYPYLDQKKNVMGVCLLLRNITSERILQTKYKKKSIESITDSLTELYTRRFFETHLEKELIRCKEHGEDPKFCVMIVDLDKFKNVNDTYGHQAGDHVIKETARILKRNTRQTDILARYGGEELVILAFDTTPNASLALAEKLRKLIETHHYVFEGKKISITVSIGVTWAKHRKEKKDLLIKRADLCLYEAKNKGRNLVVSDQ